MAKDVIVVVKRDALPTTKESLDILLISTTGAQPVGVYRDVESVKAVYGDDGKTPNSKIVRKATTLMNQGKTTLAETLVSSRSWASSRPLHPPLSPLPSLLISTTMCSRLMLRPQGRSSMCGSAAMTRPWSR